MKKLVALYDRFLGFTGAVPGVIVGLLSIGIAAEVTSRYLGLGGFYWMLDLVEYGILTLAMVGTAYVMHMGRHVTVDLVPNMMPSGVRRYLDIVVNVIIVGISLVIWYYGVDALIRSYQADTWVYKSIDFKEWIPMTVAPIGMLLFTIECIRRLIRSIVAPRTEPSDVSEVQEGF